MNVCLAGLQTWGSPQGGDVHLRSLLPLRLPLYLDVSLVAFCLQNDTIFYSILKQEDLIQCTDPDTLQVSTKDMDSTLSRASRAIKKTSKKVGVGTALWVLYLMYTWFDGKVKSQKRFKCSDKPGLICTAVS